MVSRNHEGWEDIYDLPPFEAGRTDGAAIRAWKWAEKLQNSGRLRALDLIALKALLDAVYDAGKFDAENE